MKSKVSVIIPCYNAAAFLEKCVMSVRNQSYTNLEIICINDGSTDQTGLILNAFSTEDQRIKVIHQENVGLSGTRNIGISNATGHFMIFVDADDWLDVNFVESLMSFINGRVLVCCSYKRVWENFETKRDLNLNDDVSVQSIQRRVVGLTGRELADPSQMDSLVTAWGKLYLTSEIINNKILFIDTKEIGTEDALFNIMYLNCFEAAEKVYVINEPLYYYRKITNSLSNSYKNRLPERWNRLYDRINTIISEKNSDFKTALNNRICLSIIGLGLNEMSSGEKSVKIRKSLADILTHPRYKAAFAQLDFSYFPLYWKVFFWAAKYRKTGMLYLILRYIKMRTQS